MSRQDGAASGILLFSFDYPPLSGGISRLCSELVNHLDGESQPWILSHGDARPRRQNTGVRVDAVAAAPQREWRVSSLRPIREIRALWKLRKLAKGRTTICGLWYPEGVLAKLAGAKPLVILAHGAELLPATAFWRRRLWRKLSAFVLSQADLVVSNSAYTRQLVQELSGLPPELAQKKFVSIPLGVDTQRFSPAPDSNYRVRLGLQGSFVIGTVSRLHRFKGHETVFEAIERLPERLRERTIYLIAGSGPDHEFLEAKAQRMGLRKHVHFVGKVDDRDLPDFYRALDLFALCTREERHRRNVEGFGLAFLEAQACGVPVIGTRTGGITDAVSHENGGWLIPEDGAAELSAHFSRLIENPSELKEQGLRARSRVENGFTWAHFISRLRQECEVRGITT